MKNFGIMQSSCSTYRFPLISSILFAFMVTTISFIWVTVSFAVMNQWKDEFDDICSKVQIGESLSTEELQSLIERTDKLIEKIQSFDKSTKKVYIFRLKKCRKFFEYMIELKKYQEESSQDKDSS